MKKLNYNWLILLILLSFNVSAQKNVFEKKFTENYSVNEDTKFEISNKFGNITIVNTENNRINIDAVISVKGASKEKAEDIFNKINIRISKNETLNLVKAVTEFESLKLNNIALKIHYHIQMPTYLQINLQNKYGDVAINELANKSFIKIKYGSLNLKKLNDNNEKPLSTIDLKYSDHSIINEFNWGQIIIKYANLEIKKGKALILLSKYSKLNIGSFSSLIISGGYDSYKINQVKNLVIETKYSDTEVENLSKKLNIINKYGEISVKNISKNFSEVSIESSYADIELGIDKKATFDVEAKVKHADFECDKINIYKRVRENNETLIKGKVGNDKTSESNIYIESKYGDVEIKSEDN